MGKTGAERQSKYSEKKKEDDEYKLRRADIERRYRERKKTTEGKQETALRKAKAALRKQQSRQRIKEQCNKELLGKTTEVSPSALGKVVKKLDKNMPKSPRRQRAAIVKLAGKYGVPLLKKAPIINRYRLSKETIDLVHHFFEDDSISRVDPGMKSAAVGRSAVRGIKPRRHLLYTIKEAYGIFVEKYPANKLGRSKFAYLRPTHVKPLKDCITFASAGTMRISKISERVLLRAFQDLGLHPRTLSKHMSVMNLTFNV